MKYYKSIDRNCIQTLAPHTLEQKGIKLYGLKINTIRMPPQGPRSLTGPVKVIEVIREIPPGLQLTRQRSMTPQ